MVRFEVAKGIGGGGDLIGLRSQPAFIGGTSEHKRTVQLFHGAPFRLAMLFAKAVPFPTCAQTRAEAVEEASHQFGVTAHRQRLPAFLDALRHDPFEDETAGVAEHCRAVAPLQELATKHRRGCLPEVLARAARGARAREEQRYRRQGAEVEGVQPEERSPVELGLFGRIATQLPFLAS